MDARDARLRLIVCAVIWGLVPAAQSVSAADPDDPRLCPSVPDPNDPQKMRETVSPERREQLGLAPHTWAGVVHPDVYPTLERLNRTIEDLKKKNSVEAVQALFGVQHEGTVYVELRFKDKAAQERVLARRNASELHVRQLFRLSAGLVGYVTKEGLDNLSTDSDVVAVRLDGKPLPKEEKTIYKNDLPPAGSADAANEPGVAEGRVDPDVYRALVISDRVRVAVSLHGADLLPPLADTPFELGDRLDQREQAARKLQDRVLAGVTAGQFWLSSRDRGGAGFWGRVNREGVEALQLHPEVKRIQLQQLHRKHQVVCTGIIGSKRVNGEG